MSEKTFGQVYSLDGKKEAKENESEGGVREVGKRQMIKRNKRKRNKRKRMKRQRRSWRIRMRTRTFTCKSGAEKR